MSSNAFKVSKLITALLVALVCLSVAANAYAPRTVLAASVYDFFTISYEMQFSKTTVLPGESFTVTVTGTATLVKKIEFAGVTFTPSSAWVRSNVVATHSESGARVTLNPSFTVNISNFPQNVGDSRSEIKEVSLVFPAGSTGGVYQVEGEVIAAEVTVPIIGPMDATEFLPDSQAMGAVTLDAPGLPAGGGGGGPAPTPTSTPASSLTPGTTSLSSIVNSSGVLTNGVTAQSQDGRSRLTINQGTRALTADEQPLPTITINTASVQPAPPESGTVLGVVYDFGPDGATFEPPVNLTLSYDESLIPQGITEDKLTVAYLDPQTGKWVQLSGCIIDKTNNTITVPVSHFTSFSVVAYTKPAEFVLSNLSISAAHVNIGDTVTINATLENRGDFPGSIEVSAYGGGGLTLIPMTTTIELDGHTSKQLIFKGTAETPGVFTLKVAELTGELVVGKPAAFVAGKLSISPSEVQAGQEVAINATITNIGDVPGTFDVNLKIGDALVSSKPVTLNAKAMEPANFTVSRSVPGTYTVDINGLRGEFKVVSPGVTPPPEPTSTSFPSPAPTPSPPRVAINWPLVGGIFAVYAALTAGVFWFLRRRRAGQ